MRSLYLLVAFFCWMACTPPVPPPAPFGPVPSEAQWEWQQMEMNMFIHFNMNTFTDMEWGTGAEDPALFNPARLDTDQWAQIAREAGMKGIIITAKHHDGFCLWPSAYTEHSVKSSPWRNGKGDVLKDLSESCRKYGLKFGVYLSPWDRNHADYGKPEYLEYFRLQMEELFSQYGEVFEFWIDGANGGSGYYGGANEERRIDRSTYYDWDSTFRLAYHYNPNVIIFSDGGPGCRWIGNEEGWASPTNWSLLRSQEVFPGYPNYQELRSGHRDGDAWVPGEVDVSIRPGWYYHEYEDHKVKSAERLVKMYYESVGRNGLWLLNFPVDRRGLIHPADSANILQAMRVIRKDLETDIAMNAVVTASNYRGNSDKYHPTNLVDDDQDSYWAADDSVYKATLEFEWEGDQLFDRILLQEEIRLGQRVDSFSVAALVNDHWQTIASGTTIGHKRILRFDEVKTRSVKVEILESRAAPVINRIGLFHAPAFLHAPRILRDTEGTVRLEVEDARVEILYTLDGGDPGPDAKIYDGPFRVNNSMVVKAISRDPVSGRSSGISSRELGIPKSKVHVVSVSSGNLENTDQMLDEDPNTWWRTDGHGESEEFILDLGSVRSIRSFGYLPMQGRYPAGFISGYQVYVSDKMDGGYTLVTEGEFSNIRNNPIEQRIDLGGVSARYIRFVSTAPIEGHNSAGVAELSIYTDQYQ